MLWRSNEGMIMSYYDGTLQAVPEANRDAYEAQARKFWTEVIQPAGALSMVETWGDDVPEGKKTSFPMAVKLEKGEVVVFSWVEWLDKETRDAAWAKMMAEDPDMGESAFDMSRMIHGGFRPLVSLRA